MALGRMETVFDVLITLFQDFVVYFQRYFLLFQFLEERVVIVDWLFCLCFEFGQVLPLVDQLHLLEFLGVDLGRE